MDQESNDCLIAGVVVWKRYLCPLAAVERAVAAATELTCLHNKTDPS